MSLSKIGKAAKKIAPKVKKAQKARSAKKATKKKGC